MDINETRYHLVLNKDEWLENRENLEWNEGCSGVTLAPKLFRFPLPADSRGLTPAHRRGAARDRYGNWYWIAENGTGIRTLSLKQRVSAHFWAGGDLAKTCKQEAETGDFQPVTPESLPGPLNLRGLAITLHHYLVVGVLNPGGLLIFDLHGGGAPAQLLWPEGEPFEPFDMAADSDGGVWILDAKNSKCWKLDRYFRLDPAHPFELEAKHAAAVETAPGGFVLILNTNPGGSYSTVYVCRYDPHGKEECFTCAGQSLWPLLKKGEKSEALERGHLRGHDLAFVPAGPAQNSNPGNEAGKTGLQGTLYIADSEGNQAFAFVVEEKGGTISFGLLPDYYPMRYYRGRALVAYDGNVYYDMKEQWLILTRMPRQRYEREGTLSFPAFDGKEPGCVWHRLFLDAYIPSGTQVIVESYAADKKDPPGEAQWKREPVLYCRWDGTELPYYNPFAGEENPPEGMGTWELLFQEARGRYLHLRMKITGPGIRTPYLYALRVYYPRFSYLNEYLPAAYREDETSAFFLDRFLANIEGFYTVLEGRILGAQALFDVDITAKEYLDWLAGWFGVILDPGWDENRRRLFLRHAVELFNQRGTPSGIIRAIRLAIDACPDDSLFEEDVPGCCSKGVKGFSLRIVESFLTRGHGLPRAGGGDSTETAGTGKTAGATAPGLSAGDTQWTPEMGAEPLHQRYREYLKQAYNNKIEALNTAWGRKDPDRYSDFDRVFLSPVKPSDGSETEVKDWLRFLEAGMGFTYAAVDASDSTHLAAYRNFLTRRYRQVGRLNNAYQWTGAGAQLKSFAALTLPEEMYPGGQPLIDWILFVSQILPIKENAHRFTVLVPMDLEMDGESLQQRLEHVERIVKIEQPAHTGSRVKPYWALFRVGEARLGLDTIPGRGSRFTALILGQSTTADSYLGASHPGDVKDRRVLGRDPVSK